MPWFSSKQERPLGLPDLPLTTAPHEIEQKSNLSGPSTLNFGLGSGSFMRRNAEQYANEGYAENVVTFACIHKIASAVGSVTLQLHQGEKGDVVDKHPVLDLLARPNPSVSGSDFFYAMAAWRLIAGEAFVVRSQGMGGKPATKPPSQMFLLEPQKVKINAGPQFGMPASYEY